MFWESWEASANDMTVKGVFLSVFSNRNIFLDGCGTFIGLNLNFIGKSLFWTNLLRQKRNRLNSLEEISIFLQNVALHNSFFKYLPSVFLPFSSSRKKLLREPLKGRDFLVNVWLFKFSISEVYGRPTSWEYKFWLIES